MELVEPDMSLVDRALVVATATTLSRSFPIRESGNLKEKILFTIHISYVFSFTPSVSPA